MSEKIDNPCNADSPSYLVEAYKDYETAWNEFASIKEDSPVVEKDLAASKLSAATTELLICMADARGSDLFEGCFP